MNPKPTKKLISDITAIIEEYEKESDEFSPSGRLVGLAFWFSRELKRLSFGDLIVLVGISTMTYGLWLYEPWISLTVLGVILTLMGVYPYLKMPEKKG